MRDLFPGYYRPSEEEFIELWENCIFILDTNVLLNLYRYSKETRDDFISVLSKIKDRLWIPHQVALEYQNNRLDDITREINKYTQIKSLLNNFKSDLESKLKALPSLPSEVFLPESLEEVKTFSEKIITALQPFKDEQGKLKEHDFIRDIIDELFKGKVGNCPKDQKELDEICKEGEKRYKEKCPPGFEDKKKNNSILHNQMLYETKYGDFILWKQILKKVESDNEFKHIILITDEKKDDWWHIEHGETVGPHRQLTEEILKAGASSFYMYSSDRFLEFAKEYLNLDIKEESINQVEDVAESIEEEVEIPVYPLWGHFQYNDQWSNYVKVPKEKLEETKEQSLVDSQCPNCGSKEIAYSICDFLTDKGQIERFSVRLCRVCSYFGIKEYC